jgi:glucokinase
MYIGVDIGGTNVKIGIVTKTGRVIDSMSFKTNMPKSADTLIDEIIQNIKSLILQDNLKLEDINAIGFGIPGLIDSKNGIILKAANLGWSKVDFLRKFNSKLNIPAKIENDANCALLGEARFGVAKNFKNLILITLGTGIGSSIMVDGKLLPGNSFNGECGHMVINKDGEECPCGRRGCWERYASASALTRKTILVAKEHPESKINDIIRKWNGQVSAITTFNAAKLGDIVAKKLVNEYIDNVTCGLVNLAWIFHPECFIIAGGVANEGGDFIALLQNKMDNFVRENDFYPSIEIKKTVLGRNLGIVGAASLVM